MIPHLFVNFVLLFRQLKVPNIDFVSQGNDLVNCAVSCGTDAGCNTFFYDNRSKKCFHQAHIFRKTDSILETSRGMVYYISGSAERCLDNPGYKFASYGGCLKIFRRRVNWKRARTKCVHERARLLQIDNPEKDSFYDIRSNKLGNFWMGGNDLATEGTWVWTDGTPVPGCWTPGVYHNWNTIEPGGGKHQNCMHYFVDSKSSNTFCHTRMIFVCEKLY